MCIGRFTSGVGRECTTPFHHDAKAAEAEHLEQTLGVEAFPAAVEASFCDGRYNLAVDQDGKPVKVAGTAQMWRRIPGTPEDHIGLVHALVLLDADTTALTGLLNEFEQAAGNDRHYRAESVTSIAKTAHYREGGSL